MKVELFYRISCKPSSQLILFIDSLMEKNNLTIEKFNIGTSEGNAKEREYELKKLPVGSTPNLMFFDNENKLLGTLVGCATGSDTEEIKKYYDIRLMNFLDSIDYEQNIKGK